MIGVSPISQRFRKKFTRELRFFGAKVVIRDPNHNPRKKFYVTDRIFFDAIFFFQDRIILIDQYDFTIFLISESKNLQYNFGTELNEF